MSKNVVVVIPWRAVEKRVPAFNKLLKWYAVNFPDIEVIAADSSTVNFSVSNARNNGFASAILKNADIVIFNDADSFTSVKSLTEAIKVSIIENVISIPYTEVTQHSEEETNTFLSSGDVKSSSELFTYPMFSKDGKLDKLHPCGGILVVPVEIFIEIGGFDERLNSWGPEDQIFHKEYIKRYNNTFTYVKGVLHSTYNYPELRQAGYSSIHQEIAAFKSEYTLPSNNIFVFWEGKDINDYMSDSRKKYYYSLVKNSGCRVTLVTAEDLYSYELPNYPIHEGYKYLASTHKSDYARSYLMRHYGGGYSDIKNCEFDWNPYFAQLNASDKDFVSYAEKNYWDCGYELAGTVFSEIGGNGMFIFKKNSLTSVLWYEEVQCKMDDVLKDLKLNPGTDLTRGEIKTCSTGYPLRWAEIQGEIFHKVQYENIGRSLLTMPYIDTRNYL